MHSKAAARVMGSRPFLTDPELHAVEVGSQAYFEIQDRMIRTRPLIKRTYDRWYGTMLNDVSTAPAVPGSRVLEIGSGSCYVKSMDSSVITSDIVPGIAEMRIDAERLPFEAQTLRGILLTHVFHHIPHVREFFREAVRTLVPGGVISMIEVAHTPLSRVLFGNFDSEDYDSKDASWDVDERFLGGANQALSWIVFCRDRAAFEAEFPDLELEVIERLPWLGYLLSGGVTRRDLVPRSVTGLVGMVDSLAEIANPVCSLHWHIRVRKRVD